MKAHHDVPREFLSKDWNHRHAPKRIKFCRWLKCHEWFMPDGGTQVYCSPECKRAAVAESQKTFRKCESCDAPFIGTARFCGMRCSKKAEWEADAKIQAKMPKILEMYGRQIGLRAISKETGVPRTTVRKWLDIAGKREVRDSAEARKASPIKRGDLLSANKLALAAELRNRKEKRKRLLASCGASIQSLDLFDFARSRREINQREDNRKRLRESYPARFEEMNLKARELGFKSEYHRRYETEPQFRLKEMMRRRFKKIAIGTGKPSARMLDLIGCAQDEFRRWIESQWEDWMSWENTGKSAKGNWQIDHIIPCSWFDHEKQEDLEVCWHYLNLRPLCAVENNARRDNPNNLIETIEALPSHPVKERMLLFVVSRSLSGSHSA